MICTPENVKNFIDSGKLEKLMTKKGYVSSQSIKFIDIDKNCNLKILLFGKCALCEAPHIRNICNHAYNKECVEPTIKSVFKNIKTVIPLNTHERDFKDIVNNIGGTIKKTIKIEEKKDVMEMESLILGKHPDIDCIMKFMSPKKKTEV